MNRPLWYGKLPRLSREKLIRQFKIKLIPVTLWVLGLFATAGQVSAIYTLANPADLLAASRPVMPIKAETPSQSPTNPTVNTAVDRAAPSMTPDADKPLPVITIEIIGAEYIAPPAPKVTNFAVSGRFPFGQCTYYVSTRREVNWGGNGGEWYANAQASGRPVGKTPQVGSIMASWESPLGHVAYVEEVSADGSFVVSEMNNYALGGWGIVNRRTITPGSVPSLVGFIY